MASCWAITSQMSPGRPIVSDCNSDMKQVISSADNYLKQFVLRHPSYVNNTYDFVDKIKTSSLPENYVLITYDVGTMYIDHAKGLRAVRDVLIQCPLFELALHYADISTEQTWKGKLCLNVMHTIGIYTWIADYIYVFCKYHQDRLSGFQGSRQ